MICKGYIILYTSVYKHVYLLCGSVCVCVHRWMDCFAECIACKKYIYSVWVYFTFFRHFFSCFRLFCFCFSRLTEFFVFSVEKKTHLHDIDSTHVNELPDEGIWLHCIPGSAVTTGSTVITGSALTTARRARHLLRAHQTLWGRGGGAENRKWSIFKNVYFMTIF